MQILAFEENAEENKEEHEQNESEEDPEEVKPSTVIQEVRQSLPPQLKSRSIAKRSFVSKNESLANISGNFMLSNLSISNLNKIG